MGSGGQQMNVRLRHSEILVDSGGLVSFKRPWMLVRRRMLSWRGPALR